MKLVLLDAEAGACAGGLSGGAHPAGRGLGDVAGAALAPVHDAAGGVVGGGVKYLLQAHPMSHPGTTIFLNSM